MLAIELYLNLSQNENELKNEVTINKKNEKIPLDSSIKQKRKDNEELVFLETKIKEKSRIRKSISMFKYKLITKLNHFYRFFLHCISLLAIGLLSKYSFQKRLLIIAQIIVYYISLVILVRLIGKLLIVRIQCILPSSSNYWMIAVNMYPAFHLSFSFYFLLSPSNLINNFIPPCLNFLIMETENQVHCRQLCFGS